MVTVQGCQELLLCVKLTDLADKGNIVMSMKAWHHQPEV